MDVSMIKLKMEDILRTYQGKTKQQVIANGSGFRKEVLADTVFALKGIAEELFEMVNKYQTSSVMETCNSLVNEVKLLRESIPNIVKDTIECSFPSTNQVQVAPKPDVTPRHSILIEQHNNEVFDGEAWNTVVKSSITGKLKSVPVKRSTVTKAGQGCLVFPTKEDQENAERVLKSDFKVTKSTQNPKKLMPKIKVFDLQSFKKTQKEELKEAILLKNCNVKKLVESGKSFEVVFIDEKNKCALLKTSPEIRHVIMKQGKLFIDMQAHHVKDDWHLTQCFSCQCFGHKQGSEHCKNKPGEDKCLYCGGPHRSSTCENKNNVSAHKCLNCANIKSAHIRNNAHSHTSTSKNCPVYTRELQALMNRADFGVKN